MESCSLESQVLADRLLLEKGKHLFVHLFVSCVLFAFVFVIKSLLVCYCVCSLPRNTSLLKRLFTETKNLKSPTDINMTNPEERIKWFSRSIVF